MRNALPRSRPSSPPAPVPGFEALLATARLLQGAGQGAQSSRLLLRGKNLGLVCESESDADALLFRSAAAALGASVSHIRPDPAGSRPVTGTGLLDTARVLGRLYDGIECQGLTTTLVRDLGRAAGVPVFDGLAGANHPTANLAQQLPGAESPEKKRELILQAVLLFALK
jgi:ornithine carbamoyltransferase